MNNTCSNEIPDVGEHIEHPMPGLMVPPAGYGALPLWRSTFCTQGLSTIAPESHIFTNEPGPQPIFPAASTAIPMFFPNGDGHLMPSEAPPPPIYPPIVHRIPPEQVIPYDASQAMLSPLNYDILTCYNGAPTGMLPVSSQTIFAKSSIGVGKRKRKPLVRSQLRPVLPDVEDDVGRRRRGRPPGSGNRRPMAPKTGPDGVRRFHSRSALYTGVYRTRAGRWRSQFSHRGQVVQLGMFDDEKTAAHRWDLEAIRLRGPDTQINFPDLRPLYMSLLEDMLHMSEARCINMSDIIDEKLIQQEIVERAILDSAESTSGHWHEATETPELNLYPPAVTSSGDASTVDVSSATLMDHPILSLIQPNINASEQEPGSPSISPTTTSVKLIVERFVLAADTEIKNSTMRVNHALEFIRYGENLRREAQQAFENSVIRKEEAEKILVTLQGVVDSSKRE